MYLHKTKNEHYTPPCCYFSGELEVVECLSQIFSGSISDIEGLQKYVVENDADVQAAVKKVTEELGDTGRILVRESGTEPVVRVMVEAESEEICQKYVDMVVNVIKENGYVAG